MAVAAVVLFHTGAEWMAGGFLGVSVFFTLSGYLITSLLLAEHEGSGRVSLGAFWRRRVRRLLPASAVTLVVVAVVGPWFASGLQAPKLGGDVAAAAAYMANWRFMLSGSSYLDLFVAPSPVLHFWSLAIEEQFYLVFPLLMALALRRRLRGVGLALILVAGAGLSAALPTLFDLGPDRVYFGTDTRAGELLVGAALAALLSRRWSVAAGRNERSVVLGRSGGAVAIGSIVALGVMVWALVEVTQQDAWLYRGGLTGFAVLSAAVVLGAVLPARRSPVAGLLSLAPLVALGRISYAVYLIHWPLFQWATTERTGLAGWVLYPLLIALTIGLAMASGRFLERPVRSGRRIPDRLLLPAVPVVAVAIALLAFATTMQARSEAPMVSFGTEDVVLAEDLPAELDVTAAASSAVPPPPTPVPEPTKVLVVGTPASAGTAAALAGWAAADAAPDAIEVSVSMAACGGSRSPIGVEFVTEQQTCTGWVEAWSAALEAEDPDLVVALLPFAHNALPAWGDRVFREEAQAVVDLLTSTGAGLVLVKTASLEMLNGPIAEVARAQGSLVGEIDLTAPEVVEGSEVEHLGGEVVTLASARRAAEHPDAPALRMMVLGDSVASNLGLALEQWGRRTGEALVWNAAALGCSIVAGGTTNARAPYDQDTPRCTAWREGWDDGVRRFAPDVVVVVPSLWDLPGRRLEGWGDFRAVGDARFDDWALDQYQEQVDRWSAGGATVVVVSLPCTGQVWEGFPIASTGAFDNERIRAFNDLLAEGLEGVEPLDLASRVCPGGTYLDELGGVSDARPDGLHFNQDAALWVADWLGPAIRGKVGR